MSFSNDFKRFFHFNHSERRGVFILCVLLFVFVLCAQLDYQDVFGRQPALNQASYNDSLAIALLEEKDSVTAESIKSSLSATLSDKSRAKTLTFNPNTSSEKELLAFGFYPQIAKRIIKYREKGGSFKIPIDLKKVFGVSDKFYNHIKNQIKIDTFPLSQSIVFKSSDELKSSVYEKEIKLVEINQAGFSTWLKLSQDSILAIKILKYRKALGGFVQLEQLKEIEGFSDSLFQNNLAKFNVNADPVFRKLNINLAEASQLKYHPYIGGKLAKLIIAYRQGRAFTNIEELKKLPIVNEQLFQKLKPYVFVNAID
jgi:competence protein ComEA